jgi:hypothetical protein
MQVRALMAGMKPDVSACTSVFLEVEQKFIDIGADTPPLALYPPPGMGKAPASNNPVTKARDQASDWFPYNSESKPFIARSNLVGANPSLCPAEVKYVNASTPMDCVPHSVERPPVLEFK